MSNALAMEARFVVTAFLKTWVERGQLSYKFSVHENPLQPDRVRATFSKPTQESPAAAAVAHLTFQLDERLKVVLGFTVESETHFHSATELRFDETILDHVLRRKMRLVEQQIIRLSDDFSSTRVPALMKERDDEIRDRDHEALEEYLLERLQRKDPYNDGRISFQEFKDVLYALEFPTISRRDREILFVFVEVDRDDLVDYGALIAIGAEVVDTLLHARQGPLDRPMAKSNRASKTTSADAKEECDTQDAMNCFQAVIKHQQFFTIDRLERILDTHRSPPPTPPPASDTSDDAKSTPGDTLTTIAMDDEAASEAIGDGDDETRSATLPPSELFVTRRQLRTSLESPQLLLSRAEINLIVSLATATATGEIPCSQLGELLQHVQWMVFRFQSWCFHDRLVHYLQQQFTNYESSNLQGSAEHLKKRLRQKEIKSVVKDMKKLLLTPWQVSSVVAMCEDKPTGVNHVVDYMDCIPKIAAFLAAHVSLQELQGKATAIHELQHDADPESSALPAEELVLEAAVECFEAADDKRLGVLSIAAFHSCLRQLTRSLGVSTLFGDGDNETVVTTITALADPTGQGRINYVNFQQLLYPVLRHFHHQQQIHQHMTRSSKRTYSHGAIDKAEAKGVETDGE